MSIHQLFPFVPYSHPFQVMVNLSTLDAQLQFHYMVITENAGEGTLAWPHWQDESGRIDELWQMTCFEFFLADKKSPRYLEGNFSPSGAWNIYRFEDHRNKMQRHTISPKWIPVREKVEEKCELKVSVDKKMLSSWIGNSGWILGMSTILLVSGKKQYYALRHTHGEADFHARETFSIEID